jgi:hypothetical protein
VLAETTGQDESDVRLLSRQCRCGGRPARSGRRRRRRAPVARRPRGRRPRSPRAWPPPPVAEIRRPRARARPAPRAGSLRGRSPRPLSSVAAAIGTKAALWLAFTLHPITVLAVLAVREVRTLPPVPEPATRALPPTWPSERVAPTALDDAAVTLERQRAPSARVGPRAAAEQARPRWPGRSRPGGDAAPASARRILAASTTRVHHLREGRRLLAVPGVGE